MSDTDALDSFVILTEDAPGEILPLSIELGALYGPLVMTERVGRPYVIANFVTTLDGVVAFDTPKRAGGGDVSGHNAHDRALMGLLRASADAVIVGAGTLRAEPGHLWTPGHIYPPLAAEYAALRVAMGKPAAPLTVIVSARGEVDLAWRVFSGGQAPVLIVTTGEGAATLREQPVPSGVKIAEVAERGPIGARAVLDAAAEAVGGAQGARVMLVEGGPHLLGDFLAEELLDEQFLTLAPQMAGRDGTANRPGLIAGRLFAPETPRWARLLSVRQAGDHLFLRYQYTRASLTPA